MTEMLPLTRGRAVAYSFNNPAPSYCGYASSDTLVVCPAIRNSLPQNVRDCSSLEPPQNTLFQFCLLRLLTPDSHVPQC